MLHVGVRTNGENNVYNSISTYLRLKENYFCLVLCDILTELLKRNWVTQLFFCLVKKKKKHTCMLYLVYLYLEISKELLIVRKLRRKEIVWMMWF